MKKNFLSFFLIILFISLGAQKSLAQSGETSCIRLVKQYSGYIADCNPEGLRRICTDYFIDTYFEGLSNEELRRELMKAPMYKRQELKNDALKNSEYLTTLHDDGSISVLLTNSRTDKCMIFYCVRENGIWKIDSYRKL